MKNTSVQINMKQVSYFDEEERAGCFTLMIFLMYCDCWCFMELPLDWDGLRCVIVVFPDHNNVLFVIIVTVLSLDTMSGRYWRRDT